MILPGIYAEVHAELDAACQMLEKTFGLEFTKPELYIGSEHQFRFMEISSMRDWARSYFVQMSYNDDINGIFVPNLVLGPHDWRDTDGGKAHRTYCFLHECTHAFQIQKNPQLKSNHLWSLIESNSETDKERGFVRRAFMEGMANWVSIQAAIESKNPGLYQRALEEEKELIDGWKEWLEYNMPLMGTVYGIDPRDWQKILYRYLSKEMGPGLEAHKYSLGYAFFNAIRPNARLVRGMTARPPWQIRHIVWPETYLRELQKPAAR